MERVGVEREQLRRQMGETQDAHLAGAEVAQPGGREPPCDMVRHPPQDLRTLPRHTQHRGVENPPGCEVGVHRPPGQDPVIRRNTADGRADEASGLIGGVGGGEFRGPPVGGDRTTGVSVHGDRATTELDRIESRRGTDGIEDDMRADIRFGIGHPGAVWSGTITA